MTFGEPWAPVLFLCPKGGSASGKGFSNLVPKAGVTWSSPPSSILHPAWPLLPDGELIRVGPGLLSGGSLPNLGWVLSWQQLQAILTPSCKDTRAERREGGLIGLAARRPIIPLASWPKGSLVSRYPRSPSQSHGPYSLPTRCDRLA